MISERHPSVLMSWKVAYCKGRYLSKKKVRGDREQPFALGKSIFMKMGVP